MLFYVHSGEVDEKVEAKTEKEAVEAAIKISSNKWLGEQIFVGKNPVGDSYNNEVIFSTEKIILEMIKSNSIQEYRVQKNRFFSVIG